MITYFIQKVNKAQMPDFWYTIFVRKRAQGGIL